jgi:hypothetical protein
MTAGAAPTRKAPALSETEITRQITGYLATLPGCFHRKIFGGGYYQKPGLPDLYVCYRGRSVWVEVKRPGNKLQPVQAETIERMRGAGCEVVVAHSLGELLTELGIIIIIDEETKGEGK